MTPLQSWLSRPRASVRIDTTVPWAAWMRLLRRPFGSGKPDLRPRIEVLDRLALGGKKSLLLIAIDDRRLLVGVGEDAAPSIVHFESRRGGASNVPLRGKRSAVRGRKRVRG
jgi:flagellar biogenesis protein FliO